MFRFIKKIGIVLKRIVSKGSAFARKHSKVAVEVTELLKEAVESPVSRYIVSLIPGQVDDLVLTCLQKVLPRVANEMAIAHGIIQASTVATNSDVTAAIVEYLKSKHPEERAPFWIMFAGKINFYLADSKVSLTECVALSQMVYKEIYKRGKD
jgi:hypothetical protein